MWRSVTVVADNCTDAHTLTTAALVNGNEALTMLRAHNGNEALTMLRAHNVPARLVAADGSVRTLGGWP